MPISRTVTSSPASARDCLRSRAAKPEENDPNFYYDMMVTQLPIIEAARKRNPAAWMTYATYTGFNPAEMWKNTDKSLIGAIRVPVPRFVSAISGIRDLPMDIHTHGGRLGAR